MAKYGIELLVPSELSDESKMAAIHMQLEQLNTAEMRQRIIDLSVDEGVSLLDVIVFRIE